jgi:uncharacterized protein (DUF1778 family)
MSALSLRLPNSIHAQVRALAEQEGISVNQFIATALAEKLSALLTEEYLAARAARGSRHKFLSALDRVPAAAVEPPDQLSSAVTSRRRVARRRTRSSKRR